MTLKNAALILCAGCVAAFGQAVPGGALELVKSGVQAVDTPGSRQTAVALLARARRAYGLQNGKTGYDLKVTFTADSQGQTDYDGAWEMEDQFDPALGLRWSAKAAAGYQITEIAAKGFVYADASANSIPLRLQEARAALFDPMPSAAFLAQHRLRTYTTAYRDVPVTCVLISGAGKVDAAGRGWDESEECIDVQSGRLLVHSQVAGRYALYEYGQSDEAGSLPQTVTITEGGRIVSKILVVSRTSVPYSDAALFTPTAEMKARGPMVAMASAQKISRVAGTGRSAQPVCIFGLVTASGQLVEAHSLQPSDPNSPAALEDAKQINFAATLKPGERPQQHFVFITETFGATEN